MSLFIVFVCILVFFVVWADFSNTEARAPTSAGRTPFFFTRAKSDAVCVCGLSVGHGYLSMDVLFSSIEATLIEEQQ